jgi:putative ABC transport system permease protein
MVNIPVAETMNGIVVPEYFAGQWKVKAGDKLVVDGYETVVSAVSPQHLGLTLYTSFDYISTIDLELPAVYNTVYGRSSNLDQLGQYLKKNEIDYVTIEDDKTSFASVMESVSVLSWFMNACAVVLGFTVLYSVGLINLSAREYEYMFMGVMGYPHKKIMAAHIKETVLQFILAIPLGFLMGNLLLEAIRPEFSNSNFVVSTAVFPESYLLSTLSVVVITVIMAFATSRHIQALDIVEGLKARDE